VTVGKASRNGVKRARQGKGVRRDGRSAQPASQPYATIRSDLLASAAYRVLSGNAMRLHLVAEANYHPERELFLAQRTIVNHLNCSAATASAAIAELMTAGFLVKTRAGCRPGRMGGGAKGRAAVFELPDRSPGCSPSWKRPGDPAARGSWRKHSLALRALVKRTTANQLKVFLLFHAAGHAEDGSLERNEPRCVSAGDAALPRASLLRALDSLVGKGLLERVAEGCGRRAATYRLAPAEAKGVRRGRNNSPDTLLRHNGVHSIPQ
jgi:DNA-binding MarR family transcriptional regulator